MTLVASVVVLGTLFAGVPAQASTVDSLDIKQIQLNNARLPIERGSVRQSVTCWHIAAGSWNGVNLDGVSVVVVQQRSEDGGLKTVSCYISHFVTPAQREAVLGALMNMPGGLPAAVGARGTGGLPELRIEPAVISVEEEDGVLQLRLALVA